MNKSLSSSSPVRSAEYQQQQVMNVRQSASIIARQKAVYETALRQAARGWEARRLWLAGIVGKKRKPDYYKSIKISMSTSDWTMRSRALIGRREIKSRPNRGSVAEWLAYQASILHCRDSNPAEGVDKTETRSKLQFTLDENNFWESKAM
ncbi:unnamed protein product [Protopolystoma xenopodis]|uniref:Uncharacterized protein n=1 Tax=Protopolystoma xenopodis TaxID=117903 RepID=A0A448WMG7_9PLAT|nr:unnamed protein product [Protopolystoma xenopodis]